MIKTCSRCLMDSSDPEIFFNKNGTCNLCEEFLKFRLPLIKSTKLSGQETSLSDLMREVALVGKNSTYDCVIGVSGGVDSSYLLHLACESGLRVLAVHLDNGWNSPIAAANINKIVLKTNSVYRSYVLPWQDLKAIQIAFLKAGVPEADTPTDVAIQRAVHHYAKHEGIKYILSGGNLSTEGILPISWHYNARDTKYSHSILKAHQVKTKLFRPLRFGFIEEFVAKILFRIKTIYPLNSVDFSRSEAKERLSRLYGWEDYGSKHGESKYTKFLQNYYLFTKHDIDYRKASLSSELLMNKITREEAEKIIATKPFDEQEAKKQVEYIAKKLGLTTAALEEIISEPPKWYFDYPNNKKLLGFGYDLYRKIFRKEKTYNF